MSYGERIERVASVAQVLPDEARRQVHELLEHCRALEARPREAGLLLREPEDLALRRALGTLVEQLGRRASRALPAAALGRAALADLAGDQRVFAAALADCDAKLGLWEA